MYELEYLDIEENSEYENIIKWYRQKNKYIKKLVKTAKNIKAP